LSLRPARPYHRFVRDFGPWEPDQNAMKQNVLDASSDQNKAGYKPQTLENPLGLYD
jgi:hypothetical protein